MGNTPSAVSQLAPQPNITDQIARATQIKSLMLGQAVQQGQLAAQGQEQQQRAVTLDQQNRIIAAYHDKSWDSSNLDTVTHLLNQYGVAPQFQQNVIKGVSDAQALLKSQSTENLTAMANWHAHLDDTYQGVSAADPAERQTAWTDGKQKLTDYVNMLPAGAAKTGALAELQGLPLTYNPQYIAREHGLLKSVTQLNAEALSRAEAAKDTGQGAQASQEAANLAAKSDPGSVLFDPTQAATAMNARQEQPWAQDVQAGEAQQAGAVEGAKAAAQYPYQAKLENIRQQVQQQMGVNKDAQDKIEGTYLKPYGEKMSAVDELTSAVQQAQSGNVTAARGVLLKLIGVSNPDGTKRFNNQEAERLLSQGSVAARFAGSAKNLLTGDNWTDQMSQDMLSFAQAQGRTAEDSLNRGIANVNKLYGTNVGTGLVQGGSKVTMLAPDGTTGDVDASLADHYTSKGAVNLSSLPSDPTEAHRAINALAASGKLSAQQAQAADTWIDRQNTSQATGRRP